jgi:hypothetical protein
MILRRIDGVRFSEVLPLWKGRTVVIIGGGPSITAAQIMVTQRAHAEGRANVIAVNDAFLIAPWADVQYAADSSWHKWMEQGLDKPALGLKAADVRERWATFRGQKCTIENSGANVTDETVHMMRNRHFPHNGVGLSLDPRFLVTGRNSGFQSMNLAVLAGAARILLLGFDGKAGDNGKDHFHGGHPRPTPRDAYQHYRAAMTAAESALEDAGVEVVNCTPGSAIDSFPKREIGDLL